MLADDNASCSLPEVLFDYGVADLFHARRLYSGTGPTGANVCSFGLLELSARASLAAATEQESNIDPAKVTCAKSSVDNPRVAFEGVLSKMLVSQCLCLPVFVFFGFYLSAVFRLLGCLGGVGFARKKAIFPAFLYSGVVLSVFFTTLVGRGSFWPGRFEE